MSRKRWYGMFLILALLALGLWLYWPTFAGTRGAEAIEQTRNAPFLEPDPAPFADVLADLVRPGVGVAYDEATPRHKKLLAKYLADVARATPSKFSTDEDRLAFYINGYNALVIQRVLELMPIQSVEAAGPLHAFFRERRHQVAGTRVSLHGFETKVIRNYDPLLHFGLNCASISCPPLQAEPYRGDQVRRQLEAATKAFLNNPAYNYFDKKTKTIHLSKIFEWYTDDFSGQKGIRKILMQWGPSTWPNDAKLAFLPYDWTLNSVRLAKTQSPAAPSSD